jgi:hypothetical protein
MGANKNRPALAVKRDNWPEIDRDLWRAGTTWDPDDFRKPYAAKLSEATLRNAEKDWGRFLAILAAAGRLVSTVPPAERMTRENADCLLGGLMAAGNQNSSIKARFWGIRSALCVMEPEVDTAWLTRPCDWSLHLLLPSTQRRREIIGTQKLYRWAIEMMAASADEPKSVNRCRMLRNGLIIAILACRAPRIRTLASIQNGEQLQLSASTCWLLFGRDVVKNKKPIEYELPRELVPRVRRYLEVERRVLLGMADHDAMWVATNGSPLGLRGIEGLVRRASAKEWGKAFGTHRFRHELCSALAEADSENPGLPAAVLGISPSVAERVYTHVRDDIAARKVADDLIEERERTRLLVERLRGTGM